MSSPVAGGALDPDGWGRVQNRICRGFSHHLNGRANALAGLVELLERRGPDGSLTPYLREEADRMVRAAYLFRLITGPLGDDEPVVLRRWISDVLELHAFHRGLERVEARLAPDGDDPVVRTDPAALARLVLLLLSEVSYGLLEAGGEGGLELAVVTGDDEVALEIAGPRELDLAWEGDALRGLRAAADEVPGVTGLAGAPSGGGYALAVTLRLLR